MPKQFELILKLEWGGSVNKGATLSSLFPNTQSYIKCSICLCKTPYFHIFFFFFTVLHIELKQFYISKILHNPKVVQRVCLLLVLYFFLPLEGLVWWGVRCQNDADWPQTSCILKGPHYMHGLKLDHIWTSGHV